MLLLDAETHGYGLDGCQDLVGVLVGPDQLLEPHQAVAGAGALVDQRYRVLVPEPCRWPFAGRTPVLKKPARLGTR